MKTFSDYLIESKKKYNFTIKLTFKPNNKLMDSIESALGRYDLDAIGPVRSLPIKKIDRHFPALSNPELYSFEITLNYPATPEFVAATLQQIGIRSQDMSVINTLHDISVDEEQDDIDDNTSDKALLDRELQPNKIKNTDGIFGKKYNEKLIKNSASGKAKIPNPPEPAKFVPENDPLGLKSPMTNKTTKPDIKSFAR